MPEKDRGGVERGSEIYRDKAQTLRKTKRGKSGPRKKERGGEFEAAQVSELLRMKSEPKECLWLGFLDGAAQAAVLATMTLQGQQQAKNNNKAV
ncbi:hypothetical protein IFM47457_02963 [Aspergillus lentulus]|nr:hypothetical protein IFM47457_02963 [Aspergillus lentulus]